MGRLLLAALGGLAVTLALTTLTDVLLWKAVPASLLETEGSAVAWRLLAMALALLAAFAGGYTAARMAGRATVGVGLLTGAVVTGVHIMLALGRPGVAPLWYHVTGAILIIPAVLIGVRLSGQSTAMLRRRR